MNHMIGNMSVLVIWIYRTVTAICRGAGIFMLKILEASKTLFSMTFKMVAMLFVVTGQNMNTKAREFVMEWTIHTDFSRREWIINCQMWGFIRLCGRHSDYSALTWTFWWEECSYITCTTWSDSCDIYWRSIHDETKTLRNHLGSHGVPSFHLQGLLGLRKRCEFPFLSQRSLGTLAIVWSFSIEL